MPPQTAPASIDFNDDSARYDDAMHNATLAVRSALLALSACLVATISVRAEEAAAPPAPVVVRPVSTYSIVARDARTGEMGVAVQSHWFSVGPIVPWAEPGVGAVATQSLADVRYGPLGLALMRAGRTPEQAIGALTSVDDGAAVRQVAMVDAQGRVAAHTGERCIAYASHVTGQTSDGSVYSTQANLMTNVGVPEAMARAFETARDKPLAERLVAALHAAEEMGGDIRGRQSAAVLVVRAESTGKPWEDRLVDLRIEDHPDPVVEMERLLRLHRAYEKMNEGDLALEREDVEGALAAYHAAYDMAAGHAEMAFWTAVSLVNAGRVEESLPIFRTAFKDGADWRETLRRLPDSGLFPDDPALIERITSLDAAP